MKLWYMRMRNEKLLEVPNTKEARAMSAARNSTAAGSCWCLTEGTMNPTVFNFESGRWVSGTMYSYVAETCSFGHLSDKYHLHQLHYPPYTISSVHVEIRLTVTFRLDWRRRRHAINFLRGINPRQIFEIMVARPLFRASCL